MHLCGDNPRSFHFAADNGAFAATISLVPLDSLRHPFFEQGQPCVIARMGGQKLRRHHLAAVVLHSREDVLRCLGVVARFTCENETNLIGFLFLLAAVRQRVEESLSGYEYREQSKTWVDQY